MLYVFTLIVTALAVGIIYGKKFESIPDTCATWTECRSHCAEKSEYLNVTLTEFDFDHNCGQCKCSCDDPEGCYPGKYIGIVAMFSDINSICCGKKLIVLAEFDHFLEQRFYRESITFIFKIFKRICFIC